MPVGPQPWTPEPVGGADVFSTLDELTAVVLIVVVLAATRGGRIRVSRLGVRLATMVAGPLFIWSILGAFGAEHHALSQVRRAPPPTLIDAMSRPWPQASTPALDDWRRRRLVAAGFDEPLATRLAGDDGVDLHELLVLLDRGCEPELAARIVAPLDTSR